MIHPHYLLSLLPVDSSEPASTGITVGKDAATTIAAIFGAGGLSVLAKWWVSDRKNKRTHESEGFAMATDAMQNHIASLQEERKTQAAEMRKLREDVDKALDHIVDCVRQHQQCASELSSIKNQLESIRGRAQRKPKEE